MNSESCNWANLPEHLLSMVSNLLPIRSYICARAVCSWWRAAIPTKPSLPHAPPWLLLRSEHPTESESCMFLSIPANRAIQYPLPQLHGMRCVGSYDEWLAVVDLSLNASLLNFFTGAQIHLPPMTTHPGIEAFYEGSSSSLSGFVLSDSIFEEPAYYSLDCFRDSYIRKNIFSPSPKPNDYVAFVISFLGLPVAYIKAGDATWKVLEDSNAEEKHPVFVNDIMYCDGKFYGVGTYAEVLMFDLNDASPKIMIFSEGLYNGIIRSTNDYFTNVLGLFKFIVLSNDNIMYQVWRKTYIMHSDEDADIADIDENVDSFKYVTEAFIVLRHDPEHLPCWREVRELQGQCILIGKDKTISVSTTTNIPGLRANCIYFTDDCIFLEKHIRREIRHVQVFDIKEQRIELCYPLNSQFNWPPPIWLLPSM